MHARFALGALVCALLLGFGYYLQYAKGLEPCPLCLVQRGFFMAVMAVCVVAALHRPQRRGTLAYGSRAGRLALGGAATAARQGWLQQLPPDQVPQCGPDRVCLLVNVRLSRRLP